MVFYIIGIGDGCFLDNLDPNHPSITGLNCVEALTGLKEAVPAYLCSLDEFYQTNEHGCDKLTALLAESNQVA